MHLYVAKRHLQDSKVDIMWLSQTGPVLVRATITEHSRISRGRNSSVLFIVLITQAQDQGWDSVWKAPFPLTEDFLCVLMLWKGAGRREGPEDSALGALILLLRVSSSLPNHRQQLQLRIITLVIRLQHKRLEYQHPVCIGTITFTSVFPCTH